MSWCWVKRHEGVRAAMDEVHAGVEAIREMLDRTLNSDS
jgi:hypothetical protein